MLDAEQEQLCPCSTGLACTHFHRHNDKAGQHFIMVSPSAIRVAIAVSKLSREHLQARTVSHTKGAIHIGVTAVAAPSGRIDNKGKQ